MNCFFLLSFHLSIIYLSLAISFFKIFIIHTIYLSLAIILLVLLLFYYHCYDY